MRRLVRNGAQAAREICRRMSLKQMCAMLCCISILILLVNVFGTLRAGPIALLQQTGRVWIPAASFALRHASSRVVVVQISKSVSRVVIDVSWNGEFTFLLQHMDRVDTEREGSKHRDLSRGMVVDLGAFDGVLSSNAFNFLQLGWDGLLVEATPSTFSSLRDNLVDLMAVNPRIWLENVAVSATRDGFIDFPVNSIDAMQNGDPASLNDPAGRTMQVPMMSIKTLFEKHNIPKEFDVLSVDIENASWECSMKVIGLGYRPQYIVVETGQQFLHADYVYLGRLR